MKVKHYLTKASRETLEALINHWYEQQKRAIKLDYDERIIQRNEEMKLLYIEFVTWCGFKVKLNDKTMKYEITK